MKKSIFNAQFDELKGKDSVSFNLCEVEEINGNFFAVKNGKSESYNILISDEDDTELTRNEIRAFLIKEGIEVQNISNKFPIN
jgi:hypothetical protein